MDFNQFLQSEFDRISDGVLDDDMYERFNDWIGEFDPDQWIAMAEKWQEAEMSRVKAIVV